MSHITYKHMSHITYKHVGSIRIAAALGVIGIGAMAAPAHTDRTPAAPDSAGLGRMRLQVADDGRVIIDSTTATPHERDRARKVATGITGTTGETGVSMYAAESTCASKPGELRGRAMDVCTIITGDRSTEAKVGSAGAAIARVVLGAWNGADDPAGIKGGRDRTMNVCTITDDTTRHQGATNRKDAWI